MKIVSEVYSELGKALLGVGQAIIIAALVAKFFTKELISWWLVLAGIIFSFAPTGAGLFFIQKAHNLKKVEEESHE
jgi:hypothetical protein